MLKEHLPDTGMHKVWEKGRKILGAGNGGLFSPRRQIFFVSVESHMWALPICTHKWPDLHKRLQKQNKNEMENFLDCSMTFQLIFSGSILVSLIFGYLIYPDTCHGHLLFYCLYKDHTDLGIFQTPKSASWYLHPRVISCPLCWAGSSEVLLMNRQ